MLFFAVRAAPLLFLLLAVSVVGAGCKTSAPAPAERALIVTGVVILPDSTVLFGAEISTEPSTAYVATDEEGHFWMTLPRPDAYTFIATHPDARYAELEGRVTGVQVVYGEAPHLVIMMGRSEQMPLMDVNRRAVPARRHGKKRTGGP